MKEVFENILSGIIGVAAIIVLAIASVGFITVLVLFLRLIISELLLAYKTRQDEYRVAKSIADLQENANKR